MNQINDVYEWLRERAFMLYGPTMNAAHTKTKEWLWAEEITRLRSELAAVTAERDRMLEALEPFAARDCALPNDDMVHSNISFKVKDIRRARAAIEGVTEPASPKAETEFFVFDEFAPLPEPATHKGPDEHLNLRNAECSPSTVAIMKPEPPR